MNSTTVRQVPLLDLRALHEPIREELLTAIARVVDSGRFILGDDVRLLEEELALYTGVRFGISCASGTDALYLALLAAGVERGDKVVTTPFSFFATAGSISRAGATPVFADILPDTFNLDPRALAGALERHPEVKGVIPVHLFGGCADMDPILDLARAHGCFVIEDGAQSIGAEYKGRKAQSLGDVGCISFFPSKNLGGFGDGGMLTTDREQLAGKLACLRLHGSKDKYYHEYIGTNSRLDTIQAAVVRVKLRYLDGWTAGRQRHAGLYRELLGAAPVSLPVVAPYQTRHVYNQFVIRCPRREELREHLRRHGVGTEIYYPLPLHLQACYRELGYRPGELPVSELAAREVLALPIHSALAEADVEYICSLIRSFY